MKTEHNTVQSESRQLTDETIGRLPKIELHRHLEGSFRLETLMELARKRGLKDLPLESPDAFRKLVQMTDSDTPDFLTFLSKFRADWYSTLDDPFRVAYESVIDAAKENIIYYEMRFSPEHYCRNSDFSTEGAIEAVLAGANKAAAETGMEVAYLITLSRDKLTPGQMNEYINRCLPYRDQGVVGFDLAGDELNYPPELFTEVFRDLYERTGLRSTIHAGEAVGAENVRTSVIDLNGTRIGHGFRAIEDPAVVDLLVKTGTLLEVCLTSNLQTGTVSDIASHPFRELYTLGVNVTLNSDDPQIQQSDLNTDYILARDVYGFTQTDFFRVNTNSIRGIFQPEDKKRALLKKYTDLFQQALRAR